MPKQTTIQSEAIKALQGLTQAQVSSHQATHAKLENVTEAQPTEVQTSAPPQGHSTEEKPNQPRTQAEQTTQVAVGLQEDTQTRTLRHALGRSAAYGVSASCKRLVRIPSDALRFVFDQIEGTMLGRRLVFSINTVPRLACDVAGMRLLRFATLDQHGDVSEQWSYDDVSDSAALADTLAILQKFVLSESTSLSERGSACQISVRFDDLPRGGNQGQGGVSSEHLFVSFGLSPPGETPLEAFQKFIATSGAQIIAAAYLHEDLLYALTGEDGEIDLLAGILEAILPDLEDLPGGLSGSPSQNGMIILDPDGQTGPHVLAAARGDWMLFARVIPNAQPALMRAWYATFCS